MPSHLHTMQLHTTPATTYAVERKCSCLRTQLVSQSMVGSEFGVFHTRESPISVVHARKRMAVQLVGPASWMRMQLGTPAKWLQMPLKPRGDEPKQSVAYCTSVSHGAPHRSVLKPHADEPKKPVAYCTSVQRGAPHRSVLRIMVVQCVAPQCVVAHCIVCALS